MSISVKQAPLLNPSSYRTAHSIQNPVTLGGQGLFSGIPTSITLLPSEEGGIIFERVDLPGSPRVKASLENVVPSPRCTTLRSGEAEVQTVEHLLSVLKALQIDDLLIQVTGPEIPIMDGSALPFVALIEEAKIRSLSRSVPTFTLSAPLFWSSGGVHLVALPSDVYRVSYTLHYPHSSFIGSQYYSFVIDPQTYKKEIASCRTFCLYEEILPFIESGRLKGGTLQTGVVVKDNKVLNPEGLRFADEMVRHKILDLIGDFSLIGYDVGVHVIAISAGHAAHVAFARQIVADLQLG
jgi:UDP-3-O-[3-hydroxymyristoyl] N-acetylglucosamine deacetylase